MARAELELQTVEPDPTFAVDAVRLSTAAAPVRKRRRGRAAIMATAAAVVIASAVACISDPWAKPFMEGRSFDEYLSKIVLPPEYTDAEQSITPIAGAAIRGLKWLRALAQHEDPSLATKARNALHRLREGTAHELGIEWDDFTPAVQLPLDAGDKDELVETIATIESFSQTCLSAIRSFKPLPGSDTEVLITHTLKRFDQLLEPIE